MQKTDSRPDVSLSHLSDVIGTALVAQEPVEGGKNSQVYRVTAADGASYAVKHYRGTTADGRDPLLNEYSSLTFLRQKGLDCISNPVVMDRSNGCAVYEFVCGVKVPSAQVTEADIDQASQFLLQLRRIASFPDAANLPPAAEACFTVQAIFDNLDARLGRLTSLETTSTQEATLHQFLEGDLIPAIHEITQWCRKRCAEEGKSIISELNQRDRTLSPSDFGFHNCVKQDDGRLVFLDFEYFGWDDPAKMVSDFLLHPAMDLNHSLKGRFVANVLLGMDDNQSLGRRIPTVYPLYGLKWCLILLNEFLPEKLFRRGIADADEAGKTCRQEEQLEKAQGMLNTVRNTYEHFPY